MSSSRDVRTLDEAVRARHPDPFHDLAPDAWSAAVAELAGRAEGLPDAMFLVELMRLVAMLGPRDGHSRLSPLEARHRRRLRFLGVRMCVFEEGVYVVAGGSTGLLGSRVTALAGTEIEEVVELVRPLVAADNEYSRLARLPDHLACVDVLTGLGLGSVHELALEGGSTLGLPEVSAVEHAALAPPAPARPSVAGYVDYLHTDEPTARAVACELGRLAGDDRIVLDLRSNAGGDNTTYAPVLDALADASARGEVYVLAGRDTFSAAANFVAEAATVAGVTIVGEPTGGAPNQWGDAVDVELPDSGWIVSIASLYHERIPGDRSLATEPGLAVPLRAADHFAGRDAALEAAVGLAVP